MFFVLFNTNVWRSLKKVHELSSESPWTFVRKSMDFCMKIHGLLHENPWTFFKVVRTMCEKHALDVCETCVCASVNKRTKKNFAPVVCL